MCAAYETLASKYLEWIFFRAVVEEISIE